MDDFTKARELMKRAHELLTEALELVRQANDIYRPPDQHVQMVGTKGTEGMVK